MEALLLDILKTIESSAFRDEKADSLDAEALAQIIRKHNKGLQNIERHHAKKKLLPYYLHTKETEPERWQSWSIDAATEQKLIQTLLMKPRRTASGVATITVITKPWACSSDCIYCPNDVRMPKSYLSDEPACQRAERNYFDPYLQVASRLCALIQMGHATDKIELIVLGGTWSDYSPEYQRWFVAELFRALNDEERREENAHKRGMLYKEQGLSNREEELEAYVAQTQQRVSKGVLTYNEAIQQLYGMSEGWTAVAKEQTATKEELEHEHARNESAQHRVVGLVVETRPDTITRESLFLLRKLGCTKVQIGIQSLNPVILKANERRIERAKIQEAFELLRIFGFKIHAHFMLNLYGSTPEEDKLDYQRLVKEMPYQPDEIKLYPCSLVYDTKLCFYYANKTWRPYTEEELVDLLVANTLATPSFIRISRMIRDISAQDIVVGNKKSNLRQIVEKALKAKGEPVLEIRYREISTEEIVLEELVLDTVFYETTATNEYFLQWVTPRNLIAGFLRLSLPKAAYIRAHQNLPVKEDEAMIREVHVYGKAAKLHNTSQGPQHFGLGKQLIDKACVLACRQGYTKINVISSVGTREYYRNLGFVHKGLYQQKAL